MKGISGELFFLLIFGLFVIGQHLVQWFRKNKDKWQHDARAEAEQQAQNQEADDLPFLRTPAPVPPAPPDLPEITPRRNRSREPAVTERGPARTRKRYAREALFGSQQRIQDAVVVSTILGPCRAQAPYDNGQ
jgi:hypothetical protein